ncbi:hypothetical protein GSS88_00140 [Corynebacterium sp. 3HC-13]|uniref:hypothetical protein n=1 Tax=Corynebacterium poyangense TaxID=2684405 RepID=UPI001CCF087D|nr:hypothetical protein [Corynebacterium poyangense]MBZ8176219.1 hypothetical protein [Corynebacterium poyangense]
MITVIAGGPPQSVWTPPSDVTGTIMNWLGICSYIGLAIAIIAVIVFGAMTILDKDRGEPISARAFHVSALRIALGVMIMSSAGSLAAFFI